MAAVMLKDAGATLKELTSVTDFMRASATVVAACEDGCGLNDAVINARRQGLELAVSLTGCMLQSMLARSRPRTLADELLTMKHQTAAVAMHSLALAPSASATEGASFISGNSLHTARLKASVRGPMLINMHP